MNFDEQRAHFQPEADTRCRSEVSIYTHDNNAIETEVESCQAYGDETNSNGSELSLKLSLKTPRQILLCFERVERLGRVHWDPVSNNTFRHQNTPITQHDGLYSITPLQQNTMASGAQGLPSFPPRNNFATSTKLPDRAGLNNPQFGQPAPIQHFGQTIPRRSEGQAQFGQNQSGPQPPQHGQQGRPQQEKARNHLNDLSEEQREEINEAVC